MARIIKDSGGAILVDAADGLAFPACELAIATAIERARQHGIAFAGVTNSHHAGAAGYHLEAVVAAKMVGLAFTNSPYAMPAAGGNRPRIGQAFIVIDPAAVAGREVFFERVEALIMAMLQDEEVRLPGTRRYGLARKAAAEGVEIPANVLESLRA